MRRQLSQLLRRYRRRRSRHLQLNRTALIELLETRQMLDGNSAGCSAALPSRANDDQFQVWHDSQNNESGSTVLSNDDIASFCATEQTVSIDSNVRHGALQLRTDGTFVYTPAPDFVGTDSFRYSLFDGRTSAKATATIFVYNDQPLACDDPFIAGAPISHTCTGRNTTGAPIGPNTEYSPDSDEADDSDVFPWYAEDESGSGILVFNDHQDDRLSGANNLDTTADYSLPAPGLLSNDLDRDSLSAKLVCGPRYGQVRVDPSGSFYYEPDVGFVGNDAFMYQATDGFDSSTASVRLDVHGANRPIQQSFTEATPATVAVAQLSTGACATAHDSSVYLLSQQQSDPTIRRYERAYQVWNGVEWVVQTDYVIKILESSEFMDSSNRRYFYDSTASSDWTVLNTRWYSDRDLRYLLEDGERLRFVDLRPEVSVVWGDDETSGAAIQGTVKFQPVFDSAGQSIPGEYAIDGTATVYGTHSYHEARIFGIEPLLQSSSTNAQSWYQRWPISPSSVRATVTNAALGVDVVERQIVVGSEFTGTLATLFDRNPLDQSADYQTTINWGDGSPPESGTLVGTNGLFAISGSHEFTAIGFYTASVTVTDKDFGTASTVGVLNIVSEPQSSSSGQNGPENGSTSLPPILEDLPPLTVSVARALKGGPQAPIIQTMREIPDGEEGALFIKGTVNLTTCESAVLDFFAVNGDAVRQLGSTTVTSYEIGELSFQAILQGELAINETLVARATSADTPSGKVSLPSIVLPAYDSDADGVDGQLEALAPHHGDGNQDGVPDASQLDVATFPVLTNGEFATLDGNGKRLTDVRSERPDVTESAINLPFGLFSFRVDDIAPGSVAAVTLILPEDTPIKRYLKEDSVTGELTPFGFDGVTGAVIVGNHITLHLQDGGRGDADGTPNGIILDPGGPEGDPPVDSGGDPPPYDPGDGSWPDDFDFTEPYDPTIYGADAPFDDASFPTPGDIPADPGDMDYCSGTYAVHAQSDELLVRHDTVENHGNVLWNDWSENPCAFHYAASLGTIPTHGAVSMSSDGSYTYTPDERFTGNDSFTYQFSDGYATANATVSIRVENDRPIACDDPYQTYSRPEHFTEQNGQTDPCTWGFYGENPADPGSEDAGNSSGWNSNYGYFVWNDANGSGLAVEEGGVLQNDLDLDTLTATLICQPQHGVVELAEDGTFTYSPDPAFIGQDRFSYGASDGIASDTATVYLNVQGDWDSLLPRAGFREAVEQRVQVGIATLRDWCTHRALNLDGTRFSEQEVDANGIRYEESTPGLTSTASIWYQPEDDVFVDEDDIVFNEVSWDWDNWQTSPDAADHSDLLESKWYTDGEQRYIQSYQHRIYLFDLRIDATVNWEDNTTSPGEAVYQWLAFSPLAWTRESYETWWANEGTVFVEGSAKVFGTHTYQESQRFNVSTNVDGPWSMLESILLADVSNADLIATGTLVSGEEGTNLSATVATFTDENTVDTVNLYSATIDWGDGTSVTTGEITGSAGSFSVQGSHTYDQWGTYITHVTIRDKDDFEVVSQGVAFIENVVPVSTDDSYTTSHTSNLVTLASSEPFGVLHNDLDPGSGLTAELLSSPSHGTLTLHTDGGFTYHPGGTFVGTDEFRYRAGDGNEWSALATVAIHVTNAIPVAVDDEKDVPHDRATLFEVRNNDSDGDSDSLHVTVVDPPQNGTVTVAADGRVRYEPTTSYQGPDSFTYVVNDGFEDSNIALVELSVVNRVPVAADDSFEMSHDRVLNANVTSNDLDLDGDTLTVSLADDVTHGELTLQSNGSFHYEPEEAWIGTDTFTYIATDGLIDTAATTVTITVTNADPVVTNDTYVLSHGRTLTADVTSNDADGDSDSLTVTLESTVTDGDLDMQPNGHFTYQPATEFIGQVQFTYRAFDGITLSDLVTATITVKNDAPTAVNDVFNLPHDHVLNGSVAANDHDPDGDPLTFVLDSEITTGQLNWQSNGSFSYTPPAGFSGTVTFAYHATDGILDSSQATATINVQNHAPVASDDEFSVIHDRSLSGNILTNDSDADGDSITIETLSSFSHGDFTLDPNGHFTYEPAVGFIGSDTLTYKLNDSLVDSQVATVTITVTNSPPVATNDAYGFGVVYTNVTHHFDVRVNDVDQDQDALTVEVVDDVNQGTLTQNSDGTFDYSPVIGFVGTVEFTYRLSDGIAESEIATVSLSMLPLVSVDSTRNATEGGTDGAFRLRRDAPLEEPLTVSFVVESNSTASNGVDVDYLAGTSSLNVSTGSISFESGQEFVEIPVVALDDQLQESTESITIRVLGNNETHTVNSTSIGTVQIVDHFLEVRELRLVQDTGQYDFDRVTFDPRVTGNVVGGFRNGTVNVSFDHDGDNVAEGTVTVSTSGDSFVYDPRQFDSTVVDKTGPFILRYKWTNLDSTSQVLQESPWRTWGMYLEPDPGRGDLRVDQLALVRDTNIANDKLTIDPRVKGRVLGDFENGPARVDVDHDGDGISDGFFNVTSPGETFVYDPRVSDPLFVDWIGTRTLEFAVTPAGSLEPGNPTSFSFTLQALPASTYSISSVSHQISGTVAKSLTIVGTVTPSIPAGKDLLVDLDQDADGDADRTFVATASFSQAIVNATYGDFSVAARLREWNALHKVYVATDWVPHQFTWSPTPAPEVASLSLLQDTGSSNSDLITTNPIVVGQLATTNFDGVATKIQLDTNGDSIPDATVWTSTFGRFTFTPTTPPFGLNTIRARSVRWDEILEQDFTSDWLSLSFTYDRGAMPTISQFSLVTDTGNPTDKVTYATALLGKLAAPGEIGNVQVQFDHNGDGTVDGTTVSYPTGEFLYVPTPIEEGPITIRARATRPDITTNELTFGSWTPFTFTYQLPTNVPLTISNLRLLKDDGPSATDFVTTEPSVTGQLVNDGNVDYLTVEVDLDEDGNPDESTQADANGSFVFSPKGNLGYGQQVFAVRGVEYDYSHNELLQGPWSSIAFEFVQSQNTVPEISDLRLLSDSGASDTDGLTENATITGHVVDDGELQRFTIQLDVDGDEQVDFNTFSDEQGEFHFRPSGLLPGEHTISTRALEFDQRRGEYLVGPWSDVNFTLEDQVDSAAKLIDWSISPASVTFASSQRGPTVIGQITNETDVENIGIEIDLDADGVPDWSTVTDAAAKFSIKLAGLASGQHTVAARTREFDKIAQITQYSSWQSTTIDYEQPVALPADFLELRLANDTGSNTTDGVTTDSRIFGTIDRTPYSSFFTVEFDHDVDGDVDGAAVTTSDGSFSYSPAGLELGSNTIRARIKDYSSDQVILRSDWQPISFTLEAPAAVLPISSFALVTDSGSSNSDRSTQFSQVKGLVVGASGQSLVFEFDHDGDGNIDGTVQTTSGQFTSYTPAGIPQGWVHLQVRARNTSGTQIGAWFSLGYVYSSNPDGPEAQSLLAAVTAFNSASQAAYTANRESALQSTADYIEARQQAQSNLDTATDGAAGDHQTETSDSQTDHDTSLIAANNTYQANITSANTQLQQDLLGFNGDTTSFPISPLRWPDAPFADNLVIPSDADQLRPPVAPPTYTGPSYDFSADASYQATLALLNQSYSSAVSAADKVHEAAIAAANEKANKAALPISFAYQKQLEAIADAYQKDIALKPSIDLGVAQFDFEKRRADNDKAYNDAVSMIVNGLFTTGKGPSLVLDAQVSAIGTIFYGVVMPALTAYYDSVVGTFQTCDSVRNAWLSYAQTYLDAAHVRAIDISNASYQFDHVALPLLQFAKQQLSDARESQGNTLTSITADGFDLGAEYNFAKAIIPIAAFLKRQLAEADANQASSIALAPISRQHAIDVADADRTRQLSLANAQANLIRDEATARKTAMTNWDRAVGSSWTTYQLALAVQNESHESGRATALVNQQTALADAERTREVANADTDYALALTTADANRTSRYEIANATNAWHAGLAADTYAWATAESGVWRQEYPILAAAVSDYQDQLAVDARTFRTAVSNNLLGMQTGSASASTLTTWPNPCNSTVPFMLDRTGANPERLYDSYGYDGTTVGAAAGLDSAYRASSIAAGFTLENNIVAAQQDVFEAWNTLRTVALNQSHSASYVSVVAPADRVLTYHSSIADSRNGYTESIALAQDSRNQARAAADRDFANSANAANKAYGDALALAENTQALAASLAKQTFQVSEAQQHLTDITAWNVSVGSAWTQYHENLATAELAWATSVATLENTFATAVANSQVVLANTSAAATQTEADQIAAAMQTFENAVSSARRTYTAASAGVERDMVVASAQDQHSFAVAAVPPPPIISTNSLASFTAETNYRTQMATDVQTLVGDIEAARTTYFNTLGQSYLTYRLGGLTWSGYQSAKGVADAAFAAAGVAPFATFNSEAQANWNSLREARADDIRNWILQLAAPTNSVASFVSAGVYQGSLASAADTGATTMDQASVAFATATANASAVMTASQVTSHQASSQAQVAARGIYDTGFAVLDGNRRRDTFVADAAKREAAEDAYGQYVESLHNENVTYRASVSTQLGTDLAAYQLAIATADATHAGQDRLARNAYESAITASGLQEIISQNAANAALVNAESNSAIAAATSIDSATATRDIAMANADAAFEIAIATAESGRRKGQVDAVNVSDGIISTQRVSLQNTVEPILQNWRIGVADAWEDYYLAISNAWTDYQWRGYGTSVDGNGEVVHSFNTDHVIPSIHRPRLGILVDAVDHYNGLGSLNFLKSVPLNVFFDQANPRISSGGSAFNWVSADWSAPPAFSAPLAERQAALNTLQAAVGPSWMLNSLVEPAFSTYSAAVDQARIGRSSAIGDLLVQTAMARGDASLAYASAINLAEESYTGAAVAAQNLKAVGDAVARVTYQASIDAAFVARAQQVGTADVQLRNDKRTNATNRTQASATAEADYQLAVATQEAALLAAAATTPATSFEATFADARAQWIADISPAIVAHATAIADVEGQLAEQLAASSAVRKNAETLAEGAFRDAVAVVDTDQKVQFTATDGTRSIQLAAAESDWRTDAATTARTLDIARATADRTFVISRNGTAQQQSFESATRTRSLAFAEASEAWQNAMIVARASFAIAEAGTQQDFADEITFQAFVHDSTAATYALTQQQSVGTATAAAWNAEVAAKNLAAGSRAASDINLWNEEETSRVDAYATINSLLGTPWSQYLEDVAGAHLSWWTSFAPNYLTWIAGQSAIETAYQATVGTAHVTMSDATATAESNHATAKATAQRDSSLSRSQAANDYVMDIVPVASAYLQQVTAARLVQSIAKADIEYDYSINHNVAQRDAALALADSQFEQTCKSLEVTYLDGAVDLQAAWDFERTSANVQETIDTIAADVATAQTLVTARQTKQVAESNEYLLAAQLHAALNRNYVQSESTSLATDIAAFANSLPSPWSDYDATVAAAFSTWTQATSIARETKDIADATAQSQLEIDTTNADATHQAALINADGLWRAQESNRTLTLATAEFAAITALGAQAGKELGIPQEMHPPAIENPVTVAIPPTRYSVGTNLGGNGVFEFTNSPEVTLWGSIFLSDNPNGWIGSQTISLTAAATAVPTLDGHIRALIASADQIETEVKDVSLGYQVVATPVAKLLPEPAGLKLPNSYRTPPPSNSQTSGTPSALAVSFGATTDSTGETSPGAVNGARPGARYDLAEIATILRQIDPLLGVFWEEKGHVVSTSTMERPDLRGLTQLAENQLAPLDPQQISHVTDQIARWEAHGHVWVAVPPTMSSAQVAQFILNNARRNPFGALPDDARGDVIRLQMRFEDYLAARRAGQTKARQARENAEREAQTETKTVNFYPDYIKIATVEQLLELKHAKKYKEIVYLADIIGYQVVVRLMELKPQRMSFNPSQGWVHFVDDPHYEIVWQRSWDYSDGTDGTPDEYLERIRSQQTAEAHIETYLHTKQNDAKIAVRNVAEIAYRIAPFGNALMEGADGNYREAVLSLAGDAAMVIGLGAVSKTAAGARLAVRLRVAATAIEGTVAAVRSYQGVNEIFDGEVAKGLGHLGEATLLLIGITAQEMAALRNARALRKATQAVAMEVGQELVENEKLAGRVAAVIVDWRGRGVLASTTNNGRYAKLVGQLSELGIGVVDDPKAAQKYYEKLIGQNKNLSSAAVELRAANVSGAIDEVKGLIYLTRETATADTLVHELEHVQFAKLLGKWKQPGKALTEFEVHLSEMLAHHANWKKGVRLKSATLNQFRDTVVGDLDNYARTVHRELRRLSTLTPAQRLVEESYTSLKAVIDKYHKGTVKQSLHFGGLGLDDQDFIQAAKWLDEMF